MGIRINAARAEVAVRLPGPERGRSYDGHTSQPGALTESPVCAIVWAAANQQARLSHEARRTTEQRRPIGRISHRGLVDQPRCHACRRAGFIQSSFIQRCDAYAASCQETSCLLRGAPGPSCSPWLSLAWLRTGEAWQRRTPRSPGHHAVRPATAPRQLQTAIEWQRHRPESIGGIIERREIIRLIVPVRRHVIAGDNGTRFDLWGNHFNAGRAVAIQITTSMKSTGQTICLSGSRRSPS